MKRLLLGLVLGLAAALVIPFDPRAVAVPTLLIHGTQDALAPPAIARYLARVIPGAQLREIEGGSHMLPITGAAELADAIVAFRATR